MVLGTQVKSISRKQGEGDAEASFPNSGDASLPGLWGRLWGQSSPWLALPLALSWKATGATASWELSVTGAGPCPTGGLASPTGMRSEPLPVRSSAPETPARYSFRKLAGMISLSLLLATSKAPREFMSVKWPLPGAPDMAVLSNEPPGHTAMVSQPQHAGGIDLMVSTTHQ